MSSAEFITQFANAIEVDPGSIQPGTEFKSLDTWDSLCALSIIAMVDEEYQVTLGGQDLESSNTVADIWTLIESRK